MQASHLAAGPANMQAPPLIIALEGHDGAGKSACQRALVDALHGEGRSVSCFAFNEDPFSQAIVRHISDAGLLSPLAISTALAVSFMNTVARACKCGDDVVVFHRYKYTGLLKDCLRGMPKGVSRANYDIAPDADVLIVLDVSPETALKRVVESRTISFYETEMLYTYGVDLANHRRRFREGAYSDAFLRRSFMRQRRADSQFFGECFYACRECRRIPSEGPRAEVCEQVLHIVRAAVARRTGGSGERIT